MKTKQTTLSKSILGLSRLLVRGLCLGVLAFAPAAWAATETFTTPGTTEWPAPAGVTSVTIECRGGGGAGGAAISTNGTRSKGAGGAGGSYAKKTNVTVVPGVRYKVIVGAGGTSIITGATNNSVLPEQQGGASKFTSLDDLTIHCSAVGGAGGPNGVDSSNPGAAGSTVDCVGDTPFYRGGNGGQGPANNSGGGGGGAGDANNGGDTTGNSAGAGGNAGGGIGGVGINYNANGNVGTAPGGGGAGATRINSAGSHTGGAGGNGSVKLTYVAELGVDHYAVAAGSSQTAGAPFDVTITAQDINNVTVADSINIVTLSSPDGSLMEFDWNNDGVFGDNSGTLDAAPVAGQRTIQARNKKAETKTLVAARGLITTTAPPSVTTAPTAFVKLQILAPGETAAPGTTTGRTGTPTATYGLSFNATVNAVDEFWNLVNTVTDTVAISTSAPASVLPTDAPLVDGTGIFAVTLNTVGSFTLTTSDQSPGNGTQSPATTPSIVVQPVNFIWKGDGLANQWDTITPNWDSPYGTGVPFVSGNNVVFDATSSNLTVDLVDSLTAGTIIANSALEYTLRSTSGGSITGATAITKTGSGRLILSTTNNHTGATTIWNNGAIRAAATQALGSGEIKINGGANNNGGLELIGGISLNNPVSFSTKISGSGFFPGIRNISGDNTLSNTIGTFTNGDYFMLQSDAGLLTLGTTGLNAFTLIGGKQLILQGAGNGLFAGNITTTGTGSSVTKAGAGTWTFGGSTSHSGGTTINGGTLALGASGTILNSNSMTIAAGATFDTSLVTSHVIPATRPLTFGIDATDAGSSGKIVAAGLDISAAVVTAYTITGTPDDPAYVLATYTSLVGTPSFASVPTPPDGYTLKYDYQGNKIALVSANDPYETWAGAGVNGFDADANGDGVDNGLAWLLGAANKEDSALNKLPVVTQSGGGLVMTFDMLPASARGTATLLLEYSTDLATWSTGEQVPEANDAVGVVTFTVSGTNPLDVEATVSSSEALAGKLFGRLKAVK